MDYMHEVVTSYCGPHGLRMPATATEVDQVIEELNDEGSSLWIHTPILISVRGNSSPARRTEEIRQPLAAPSPRHGVQGHAGAAIEQTTEANR
jgi:hypothetical protein